MFYQAIGLLLLLIVGFVFTEGHVWHRPTIEFLFWVSVLWAGTSIALLAPDSPILFFITVNRHPASMAIVFGVVLPLYFAVMVQSIIESGLVSFQEHRGNKFQERLLEIQRASRAQTSASGTRGTPDPLSARRSRRTSSALLDSSVVNEQDFITRSKQQYVSRTLDRLVFTSQLRHFAAWFRGQIDERQEALRKVMQDATPDELNHIIGTINVPKLFRHGTNGHKMNNILQYLMEERHSDLTTIARASILHGLMRTQTLPFFKQQMEWSVNVFCGAKGPELTLLKNMLDSSGDFNNLFKFVYNDISRPELRKKMLKHIKEEGKVTVQDNQARGHFPIKVLSDVDDTLSCSGGSFPAGADPRYPRHAVYPGVLALYEEIDLAARETSSAAQPDEEDSHGSSRASNVNVEVHVPWQQGGGNFDLECSAKNSVLQIQDTVQARFNVPPRKQKLTITNKKSSMSMEDNIDLWKDGNLVFVSARPHVFKDVAENGSYRRFHKLVNEGRMHCTPTMLSGSLTSGTLALVFRFWEKIQLVAVDWYDMALAMVSSLQERAKKKTRSRRKRSSLIEDLIPEPGIEDNDDEGGLHGINAAELQRSESSFIARNTTNKNWEAVGKQKVDSIEKYSVLYPEYELVFFGDNGQGDLLTAELISTKEKVSNKVRMCFIHKIQSNEDDSLLSIFSRDQREEKWNDLNIVFFETYVEAATVAYEKGLISAQGLHRVGLAVHDELLELFVKYPHRDWTLVHNQTRRDIRRANKVLRSRQLALQIPVPILPSVFSTE